MGSWKNRKNRNIILIWIHKYLILRGSWKSWEEITRTSEWVWQWETGIDQCCENLFVKHSKVRKKKKKLGFPCDDTPTVFSHQPLLQLCPAALLKNSPSASSQSAAPAQLEENHPGFYVDTSDFSAILSEPRTKCPKAAPKAGKGKKKIRKYRQDKEGSKPLAWRPAYCCQGKWERSQNFLQRECSPSPPQLRHPLDDPITQPVRISLLSLPSIRPFKKNPPVTDTEDSHSQFCTSRGGQEWVFSTPRKGNVSIKNKGSCRETLLHSH